MNTDTGKKSFALRKAARARKKSLLASSKAHQDHVRRTRMRNRTQTPSSTSEARTGQSGTFTAGTGVKGPLY